MHKTLHIAAQINFERQFARKDLTMTQLGQASNPKLLVKNQQLPASWHI